MSRVIAFLLCSLISVSAQNADWRFAHPNAKVLIGLKVRHILDTPLAAAVRTQFNLADVPDLSVLPFPELLNEIDEVLVSSPGPAPGAGEKAQPPVLIRVTGRFEPRRVEAFFQQSGAKLQMYRKYRVYRHKTDGDMAATLIDPHTLLVGDAPSLFSALERVEWSDAPQNPLLARAVELHATSDFWSVFATAPSAFSSSDVHFPLLDSVHGMELSGEISDALVLRLGLRTDSPDDAAKLSSGLKSMLLMAAMNNGGQSDLGKLARGFRLDVDGATARVEFRATAEQMKKAIAEMKKQRTVHEAQVAALHRSAVASAPPSVPERRVIRIEGLDDGPREIPYNK